MRRFKGFGFYPLALALILILALASGCTRSKTASKSTTARPVEVNVWAAATLTDALPKLAPDFEKANNAKLVFNFASAADLQIQIEQGGRADVFLSAAQKQMDALARKHLIDSASRANFLSNRLVVAVPADSNVKIARVEDIAALPGIRHIAIGHPGDPSGNYARQSLETARISEAIKSKLVFAKDVRQVLAYLETDEVDLGFVYASDLHNANNVKNALTVPDTYHDPIVYPMAVVRAGRQPKLAAKFTDYLRGRNAQKVFADYGFKPAPN